MSPFDPRLPSISAEHLKSKILEWEARIVLLTARLQTFEAYKAGEREYLKAIWELIGQGKASGATNVKVKAFLDAHAKYAHAEADQMRLQLAEATGTLEVLKAQLQQQESVPVIARA